MSESNNAPPQHELEPFDEAQPFLQLLADLLKRLRHVQSDQEDIPATPDEETAG